MPLNQGTKNIIAIYKGLKSQSAIYKGTKLVYSSAFWQSLFYSYLYHDLIPTTINNKNVLDLAKVSKIYANGVVENQLIPDNYPSNTFQGVTIAKNNDGSYTLNGTSTAVGNFAIQTSQQIKITLNHKYLLIANGFETNKIKVMYNNNGFSTYDTMLLTGASSSLSGEMNVSATSYPIIRFESGVTFTNKKISIELIDLTLMFGAGNEPTAITDKRIQAILNRGYIPYNTGEYKGTNIGSFSSEPYNLCDKDFSAYLYGDDYLKYNPNNSIFLRAGTYVIERSGGLDLYCQAFSSPNTSDYLLVSEAFSSTPTNTGLIWSNHGWQTSYASTESITFTLIRSCYLTFCGQTAIRNNVCIHVFGTRTGYAPYVAPTLPAIYQSTYKQIEFIQNSGTQYLNLGFVPNTNEKWAFELDYTDVSASGSNYVMGSRSGSSTIYFGVTGASATKAITVANTDLTLANNYRVENTEYLVKASYIGTTGGTCSLLNKRTNVLTNGTQNVSLTGSSVNVYLFALNSSNIHSGMKVHYLKIWKADTLYLDLVPVKRISDGVVGLLDKLNNVFYTNAGSGTFVAGKEIQAYNELPFIYQGNGALNAKDTYELTKDNHIFTKNVGMVDLGSVYYTYDSSGQKFYTQLNGIKSNTNPSVVSNMVCNKYTTATQNNMDANIDKIITFTKQEFDK